MTEEIDSTVITPAEPTVPAQTQLTEELPPQEPKQEAKPQSRRDSIEASLKKIEDADKEPAEPKADNKAKADDAAATEDKAVKAEDAKQDADDKADDKAEGKAEAKTQERRAEDDKRADDARRAEAPQRFTDEAKAVWRNTPREVKAEVERTIREFEAATEQHREAKQLHDEIKPYVDMARQAGVTVKAALDRYVAFDRQIAQDFGKGIASIAQDQGKSPVEAIGSLLRAYGLTPQQYAQHVAANPDAHQVAPQAPRDPMIEQVARQQWDIMKRLETQDRNNAMQSVQSEIDNWAADKPDFASLETAIAEVIKSGIIERIHGEGLSMVQRLDVAYRMAGGQSTKASDPQDIEPEHPPVTANTRSNGSDAGTLSIAGAPGGGKEPTIPRRSKSRRDSIEAAFARISAQ